MDENYRYTDLTDWNGDLVPVPDLSNYLVQSKIVHLVRSLLKYIVTCSERIE